MSSSAAIHIVSPDEFDAGTAQTPGSERRAAVGRACDGRRFHSCPAFVPHMEINPSTLEAFR